jgi:putative ABC transport system permease protein
MSWLHGLSHRVRALLNPGAYEREVEDEMAFHRERLLAEGESRFGNQAYHKEEARRMTWINWLDTVKQDIGYAWRSIRRAPATTATIVITLALGIGVNAATFSVLDQIFLRPPAGVRDAGEVHRIFLRYTRGRDGQPSYVGGMPFPVYRAVASAAGTSSQLAVTTGFVPMILGGTRAGYSAEVLYTSANYFSVLGVQPALGRFYSENEALPGTVVNAIVVSHRFWKTHLGGDTAIINRPVKLGIGDQLPTEWTVIGVAAPSFDGLELNPIDIWAPLGARPGADRPAEEGRTIWESMRVNRFAVIARTGDAESIAAMETRSTAEAREAARIRLGSDADSTLAVVATPLIRAQGPVARDQGVTIATRLQGVGIIVLIIACANVVNLLLARAVSRRREIAVRLALGISRRRLIRLITIEAVLLALCASAGALVLAEWGGRILRSRLIEDVRWIQPALHAHVVWATLAVALGCGLVAGIIPALQCSRPELTGDLKGAGRGSTAHRSRLRAGLLAAQAALSVTLLVGAALLVRTFDNVAGLDLGFDRDRVLYARVRFDPGQEPPLQVRQAAMRAAMARLESRRGVEAVARSDTRPMSEVGFRSFWWDADSSRSIMQRIPIGNEVSSAYFAVTGMRMLRGRSFADSTGIPDEVVINEALAKLMWPQGEAIGRCVRFNTSNARCMTVVGIVSNARRRQLIEQPWPLFYLPMESEAAEARSAGGTMLLARARPGGAEAAAAELNVVLKEAMPTGYVTVTRLSDALDPLYRPWRLGAQLFAGVGILALLVSVIGIYSTMAHSVGQRTREFGVRMALGAKLGDVINQVVGEGMRVIVVGIATGVVLAMVGGRLVSSLLYGVQPTDPSAMLLAVATLLLVAIVAAVIPAWRAARVDPVTALRGE